MRSFPEQTSVVGAPSPLGSGKCRKPITNVAAEDFGVTLRRGSVSQSKYQEAVHGNQQATGPVGRLFRRNRLVRVEFFYLQQNYASTYSSSTEGAILGKASLFLFPYRLDHYFVCAGDLGFVSLCSGAEHPGAGPLD